MKKLFKTISILLVMAMILSFVGCGPTTPATPTDPAPTDSKPTNPTPTDPEDTNKFADIAGEYLLDASNLGMPMKWYIKITADGKFVISTTREYTAVKGEGTVGTKDGTYMFMYSDSTQESPKTATFTFEGKNMVFSTNVPIGAASVSPNADEGKFPTAKLIACEDILGTYMGTFEKVAMGSAVVYNYELVLGYGMEYTFTSSFTMMGGSMTRVETGTFAIDGTAISFTATVVDGEAVETPAAVTGTIADNSITAAFKLSSMASAAQEVTAKLAIYADYAGTYTGLYEKAMGPMVLSYKTVLVLDAFGGYTYTTYSGDEADLTQAGTYTVENGAFAFLCDGTTYEGTLASFVMSAKFPISAMVSNAVDLQLYADEVSGKFESTVTEGEKTYKATLELIGNTFTLTVGIDGANAPAYIAKGTFAIQKAMTTNVVLTTTALVGANGASASIPVELATVSCPVAESGINAELVFDLDDTATLGFQMAKVG